MARKPPITLGLHACQERPEELARRSWTDVAINAGLSLVTSRIAALWTPAQPLVVGFAVHLLPTYLLLPSVIGVQADAVTAALRGPAGGGGEPRITRPLAWVPAPPRIALELMDEARLEQEAEPREILDERDAEIQRLQEQLGETGADRTQWILRYSDVRTERDELQGDMAGLREGLAETREALAAADSRIRALEEDDVLGSVHVSGAEFIVRQQPPGRVPIGSEVRVFVTHDPNAATVARGLSWSITDCVADRLSASTGPFVRFVPAQAGLCRIFLRSGSALGTPQGARDVADYGVIVVETARRLPLR